MRRFAVLPIVLLFASLASAENSIRDEAGSHLDILRDGKPLVRYMYAFDTSSPEQRHDTYKVYHHVLDAAGENPITKGPGGKFTHHRGIFIGFARLGYGDKRYDLWHMKDQCNIVHKKFLEQSINEETATVSSLIHWEIAEGQPIIEETRTLTIDFTAPDAHLMADWTSELKAVAGDIELRGDPEHAGIQYRPHNDVAENKSAKYTFHKDGIDPKKDKDLPWVALHYQLNGQSYNVQHMRHPSDPTDSVYSAYRDYGRFGNYFVAPIKDGETLTLRYRFRITTGDPPSRDALAKQFQVYIAE